MHPLPPLLRAIAVAALMSGLGGCHARATRPPYAIGSPPTPAELLDAAAPQLSSVRVSSAKIRLNRSISGNLMILAQAPDRFAGQIQVSGKELISLAFHEDGYALRYVAGEGLPIGFYSGPPSACAIEELLGVSMAPREVIALILGGAPLLPEPREVVGQGWDRREGHEVLRLRDRKYEEEVTFRWLGDRWWASGATLWLRLGGDEKLWLWTIAHEGPRLVDGRDMPSRTVITRPDGRRKMKVTITYNRQEADPTFEVAGDDSGWGDDGGWEDEAAAEGGWEDEDGATDLAEDEAHDAAASNAAAASPDSPEASETTATTPSPPSRPATQAKPSAPRPVSKPKPKIPAVFIVEGDGLPVRGDLCRSRR